MKEQKAKLKFFKDQHKMDENGTPKKAKSLAAETLGDVPSGGGKRKRQRI